MSNLENIDLSKLRSTLDGYTEKSEYEDKIDSIIFDLYMMQCIIGNSEFDENDQSKLIKDMNRIKMLSGGMSQRLTELKKPVTTDDTD